MFFEPATRLAAVTDGFHLTGPGDPAVAFLVVGAGAILGGAILAAFVVADVRRQHRTAARPPAARGVVVVPVDAEDADAAYFEYLAREQADRAGTVEFLAVAPGAHRAPESGGDAATTAHIPVIRPVDVTEAITIDPTLSQAEAAEVAEHVSVPGAGSMASLREAQADTGSTRTPTEQRELDAAWDPAHVDHELWRVEHMFDDFDRAMFAALSDFEVGTRKVGRWLHLHHDDDPCPHCELIMHEVSAEYRQIVGSYDTGRLDIRAELDAMLAADAAAKTTV